ncbi:MAG: hypothetical protein ACW99L_14510, partial [Promethearchaeota archaeon]
MKLKKKNEKDSRPINLVLLAFSFIIFGTLGLAFITQMELQAGWAWEDLREFAPVRLTALEAEDFDGNGATDIISYADVWGTNRPEEYQTLRFGGIYRLDGLTGGVIWDREFENPVRKLFQIMDVDGDGFKDYFMSKPTLSQNKTVQNGFSEYKAQPNRYTNQLINGSNGNDISILTGDGINFTNSYVHSMVSIGLLADSMEDLILLEIEEVEVTLGNNTFVDYNSSISAYFVNGTKNISIVNLTLGDVRPESPIPVLELYQHNNKEQLLFITTESLLLLDLSSGNFLNPIYNTTFPYWIDNFAIIEDLNLDGMAEILVSTYNGNMALINGADGGLIRQFEISPGFTLTSSHGNINIKEILSDDGDGITYVQLSFERWDQSSNLQEKIIQIYSLDLTSEQTLWEMKEVGTEIEMDVFIIDEDLNGDSIGEVISHEKIEPAVAFGEVQRYTFINFVSGKELHVINTEYHA